MELKSPDGKITVDFHPSKVESKLARGWKPVKEKKSVKKADEEIEKKESE
jgi:hypothetical protein